MSENNQEYRTDTTDSNTTASLFNKIYSCISGLGFETIRYTVLFLTKFIKILAIPTSAFVRFIKIIFLYFIKFIKHISRNIVDESNSFFNDLHTAGLIYKQNKNGSVLQRKGSFYLLKDFVAIASKKHKRFLKKTFNYILPAAALMALLMIINGFNNTDFALDVTYNDVHIGYIESENVFRDAEKILEERLKIGGQEYDKNPASSPEYAISVVKLNELSDSNEICEQIISNSDSGLLTACGVYIDDKFICSVINESDATSVFKSIINEYCTVNKINQKDSNVMIDLVEKVSYVQGLYSEQTLMNSVELRQYLKTHKKSEMSKYTVTKDDSVSSICQRNNLTPEQFYAINPTINPDEKIKKDTIVNIIKSIPFINISVSRTEESVKKLKYNTIEIKTNSLYQGVERVIARGKEGEAKVTNLVTYVNGVKVATKELSSTVIKKSTDRKVYVGTKPIPANVEIYGGSQKGAFIWPVVGANYITSGFGYRYIFGGTSFHRGIDISGAGANGKPVIASASGTVEKVTSSNTGYGYSVLINHGNGIKTRYAHCQAGSITVKVGQQVVQGQKIAKLGNTGNSTGPHLHFEIIYNGGYANPINYLTR